MGPEREGYWKRNLGNRPARNADLLRRGGNSTNGKTEHTGPYR